MHPIFKYQFFIIVIPGLEELALREIKLKLGDESFTLSLFEIKEGGILVSTDSLNFMDFFHLYLRIPTRILLRIHQSKVRDFPKLFNHFKKIEWQKYIPWVNPSLSFSSRSSKVFDERKVLKCLEDAVKNSIKANEPKKKYKELAWQQTPCIYVRIEDDVCTTSIDLTGERLDRRGLKTNTVNAPIRESIGAAIALLCLEQIERSGERDVVILDPMAGSATLPIEIFSFFEKNNRAFNYKYMPSFSKEKYDLSIRKINEINLSFILNDLDKKCIESIELNIKEIPNFKCTLHNEDFFKITLPELNNLYIICNPPYDKRIKIDTPMDEFLTSFIDKTVELNAKSVFFVTPIENKIKAQHKEIKFLNGGIKTKIVCI